VLTEKSKQLFVGAGESLTSLVYWRAPVHAHEVWTVASRISSSKLV
jgi:hypothetical protein